MIIDIIKNVHSYQALNKGFVKAIDFLSGNDLSKLSLGRHEIDGDRVYAVVAKEPGRMKENALLEIHEKYIDIQVILDGTDTMGWKSISSCKESNNEYNKESDIKFLDDEPDLWVPVEKGHFAIFFPEDAHMPLISESPIHKIVVKIAVEQ
ncbi:MAG: YhcH/YjgK/YiaL family protein [Kiritimatiellae bacterium]|jgi:biofilm protein TabA|nr:YhcH/YjgK/YiaL family protein [Kiritimatiellia bacterium]